MKKIITYSLFTFTFSLLATVCSAQALTVSDSVLANVSCNGNATGSASVLVSGGATPYTYSWFPAGGTGDTATGLSAGTYMITVLDNVGDTAVDSVNIMQPNPLGVTTTLLNNVTCSGGSNGSALANPIAGTSPYTYLWSDGSSQTTAMATGLTAGTYGVSVTDSCGATVTDSITISGPRALTTFGRRISNASCFGASDGSADARPRRGSLPYTYSWSPSGETTDTATGLSAGVYTVTVTDSCGASATGTVTISQPNAIALTTTSTADGGGCTGSAGVTVTGGTRPYTYAWTGGGTTATITSQCNGTYCCQVTDAHGCMDSACVTILASGIENISANSANLSVYPSPSKGQVTIQMPGNNGSLAGDEIQVFNELGQSVYPSYIMGSRFSVDLSSEPNGMYVIRVITNKGYLVGESKVIIQK